MSDKQAEATGQVTRALFYCDANLNLIDGSSMFVVSMCQVLSALGVQTTVVLRAVVESSVVLGDIERLSGVHLVRAVEQGLAPGPLLTPDDAAGVLTELDAANRFDLVIVRSRPTAVRLAESGLFDNRLWVYPLDIPQRAADITDDVRTQMSVISASSQLLLVQTPQFLEYLVEYFPSTADKSYLWHPVVPNIDFPLPPRPLGGPAVRLGYMGKYAREWNTMAMTTLPALFAARGIDAEVHMVGDKIGRDPRDPDYVGAMRAALQGTPGVVWHGGVSRRESMQIAAGMDFGLAWRAAEMDTSPELQTKLLEFAVLRVPPLLRRTPLHEDVMGPDYPFFVSTPESVVDVVVEALGDPSVIDRAAERCRQVTVDFGFTHSLEVMAGLLNREIPGWQAASGWHGQPG